LERLRSALLCHDGCIASKKGTLFLKIEILLNNFSSFCAKDEEEDKKIFLSFRSYSQLDVRIPFPV